MADSLALGRSRPGLAYPVIDRVMEGVFVDTKDAFL